MNLEKLKKQEKSGVIIFTVVCFLFIFYISFVWYCKKENFDLIRDNEEEQRDLYFAYYIDDVISTSIPNKASGYTLSDKSSCTNGVDISWDQNNWSAIVNYTNYNQEEHSRTKCNLYFEKLTFAKAVVMCGQRGNDATECFKENYRLNETELVFDETVDNNLRYIGASPNNYIDIGDRDASGNIIPWRIIGVMNNVGDGNGNNETRLKIIRSEDIGGYSWDTSASSINNDWGINEWSEADLMKLLNPGYENESVGGSLYWNKTSGNCYNGSRNANIACDFTSSGLSNDAKSHIGEALWHTGSNGSEEGYDNILTSKFYELEKSNNTGKICTSGTYCNDNVERTTTWKGLVGLMSPSDYGYATSGGNSVNRETCLTTRLFDWAGTGVAECKNNDWLYKSSTTEWTIMPSAYSAFALDVFYVYRSGYVDGYYAYDAFRARPVVYLKADTKITSGDGTLENIFNIQA